MPERASATVRPESGSSVGFDLGAIRFTQADAGATYHYTVSETGEVANVANDAAKVVVVHVEDAGDGTLEVTSSADDEPLAFANAYSADGEVPLRGAKAISGREFRPGDEWSFSVKAATKGAPLPERTRVTVRPTSGASATVDFGAIRFTDDDFEGVEPAADGSRTREFSYVVSESGEVAGVANDADKTVTFAVTDDAEGAIAVAGGTSEEPLVFANDYDATGKTELVGAKELLGRAFREGDAWTFAVAASEGAPLPERTHVTIEPEEGTRAELDFGTIRFTEADAGKTYTYTITEAGDVAGVTNDAPKAVVVHVADKGDGTLEVTNSAQDGDTPLVFTNVYRAAGETGLVATKELVGRDPKAGDVWTFAVAAEPGTPMPERDEVSIDVHETPSADFGLVRFTEADAGKTYTYTITESGDVPGVTNDAPKTVTVRVVDDGDGTLEVHNSSMAEDDPLVFTNAYDATGTAELAVRKSFGAQAWPAGRTFDFELLSPDDHAPLPKRTSVTGVGQHDAEQSFGTISFSLADLTKANEVGARYDDFTYVVREVVPHSTKGVTYDTADHVVTVHVEDAGDGTLATSYAFGDDAWAEQTGVATVTITNGFAQAYHFENVDERDSERLGGATLTLVGTFVREDGTTYDGEIVVIRDGKSYETVDGHLIPGETYTLVDTQTPPGYTYFSPVILAVTEDGELVVKEGDGVVSDDGHTVTVAEKPTALTVQKTDLAGEPITSSAAQFSVSPIGETVFANVDEPRQPITAAAPDLADALLCHLVASKLHNARGELTAVLPVDASVYELRETVAPRGYQTQPDPIYFVLDEYGAVHLATRTSAGYRINDESNPSVVRITDKASLSVADPANLLRFHKTSSETKEELVGVTYRIEGEFADDSTSIVITDEDGQSLSLDRLLVNGNTYTIAEEKAPPRYKRDRQTRAFSLDGIGTITFDGDAGGYTAERVYDESLGQWVSVIHQEDEPVQIKHPTPAIEPVYDPSLDPDNNPSTEPGDEPADNPADDHEHGHDSTPTVEDDTSESGSDTTQRPSDDAASQATSQQSTQQRVVTESTTSSRAGATTTGTAYATRQQSELATTADATDARMSVSLAALGAGVLAVGVCYRPSRRKERR